MIDPIFEIVGLLAAFLTTSAFIPQVYKIYKEKIHYAFFKLTENLIHTYKYYYTDNHTIEELQHNAIIFLLERLDKFKPNKGKAYSYFGTIAKRYFIFNNQNNYKKLQTHQDVTETIVNDEEVLKKELQTLKQLTAIAA